MRAHGGCWFSVSGKKTHFAIIRQDQHRLAVPILGGIQRNNRQRFALGLEAEDVGEFQITIPLDLGYFLTGHILVVRRCAPDQCAPRLSQFCHRHFFDQLGVTLGHPFRQFSFKGLAARRFGMFLIPHRMFLLGQQLEIRLHDGLLEPPLHVAVEPVIHACARHIIVVVAKMREVGTKDILLFAVESVELLQFRVTVTHHCLGPIVCGSHPLRARGKQGC